MTSAISSASRPPTTTRAAARTRVGAAETGADHPQRRQPADGHHHRQGDAGAVRSDDDHEDGEQRTDDEAERRHDGGLPWVGEGVDVDAQLVAGVDGETIGAGGQFVGHPLGQRLAETSVAVDLGELVALGLGRLPQLLALAGQVGELGVALGADRDVLTGGHRESARGQPGDPGDQHGSAIAVGGSDAHDQGRGGDQPVIGTEHAGPQPIRPVRVVALGGVVTSEAGHGAGHVVQPLARSARRQPGRGIEASGAWKRRTRGEPLARR